MQTFSQFLSEKDELVATIEAELKKAGYNRTKVTVRYRRITHDRGIQITIKDLNINKQDIEKIVKKYEKIDWDEINGEILAGGNTYIDIEYDQKIVDAEKNRLKPIINKAITDMKANLGGWIELKNGLKLSLPKGYFGDENLVYSYEWKRKMYTPNKKDFIRPLWLLLYKTGL